jgi:nucleoside-diphosphate-sugar epimerase
MHPTIAGVFNGAMVLRDTSIRNMTFSQLNDVVRPKVMGSLNLDRIFSSTPLDFFVLFSSTNFIIGNQGQANYAAANAFQCALASSRRKRGLMATAVNIGAIIGAGYIQRSTNYKRVLDLTVTRGSMMHLSEEDFHQLIAEAIANDGDGVAELTTGVLEVAHDTASPPLWFTDPKFVHLVVQRRSRDGHDSAAGSAAGANYANINNNSNPAAIHERIKASRSAADAEKVLTEAFAALLRQELQIVDRDDSALMEMRSHEIGLDSLVSVDIRSWFLKAAGVSIPVLHIMSNNTMASLVRLAVESLPAEIRMLWSQTTSEVTGGDGLVAEVMDWEAETRPPSLHDDSSGLYDPSLESSRAGNIVLLPSPPSSPPQTIVLTGTTGLLGSCLLNHVLQILPANGKVFCIGIRRRLTTAPDPRSIFYAGNLALPRLGLTPSACASIFAAADAVIHVGADTAHLKPYAALRQANVGSTAELARLCVPRKIPLHYVSTVGVAFISREMELRPERVGGDPPQTDSEGYTTSKWVCERLLERISAQTGLPVWIHRPSSILRLGVDNEGERASMDWLNGLLRYSRRLGAVPDVKYNQGVLDMVYPKTVCVRILQHLLDHRSENAEPQGVSYVHHVGDIVIPLNRMHEILELDLDEGCGQNSMANDRARTSCEVLPMAEWTARARAEGLHPAVIELIEGMDGPDRPHFPSLVKSAPRELS